jgi:signal transduction histidine kinase
MLKSLRWRLTLTYLVAALGLVASIGFGTYVLIQHYFQQSTDLALQYKMAGQFRSFNIPLPTELARVEREWLAEHPREISILPATPTAIPLPTPTPMPTPVIIDRSSGEFDNRNQGNKNGNGDESQTENEGQNEKESQSEKEGQNQNENENDGGESLTGIIIRTGAPPPGVSKEDAGIEEQYDSDLAPIFVIPLDAQGKPVTGVDQVSLPIQEDTAASMRAMLVGYDWRTINLNDGTRARLLTYRLSDGSNAPAILQMGRLLSDQDRFMGQFLTGLFAFGAVAALFLGLASWWLAGRSLGPAQKAWDQQQIFIANASHELRAPLTLLRATAEFALRENTAREQHKALQEILKECDYMNSLVEDLLLLSRLDNKHLQISRQVVPLNEMFADITRLADKLCQEKKVSLVLDNANGAVWGDPSRLRQILLILLDNSLRFTQPGGSIHLNASLDGNQVVISVSDNGRGIAAQHLPHLFDRFYQVHVSGNDDNRGNGLGLSIAKALVEAQNGNIQIRSLLGQGTQVSFSLPAA